MTVTKISGGSVVLGQLFLLIFLLPLVIIFSYLTLKKLTFDVVSFLLPLYAVIFLIFKNGFSYTDVYIVGDELIFKKIFFKKRVSKNQINEVDKGFLPITFYISLNDGSKFFFQSSIFDLYQGSDKTLSKIKDKLLIYGNINNIVNVDDEELV